MIAAKAPRTCAPVAVARTPAQRRNVCSRAYGDKSQYFDLKDLENTVGAWDMYGQEDTKRYPSMQGEFFERAASGISNRGAMLRLCAGGLGAAILVWGGLGSAQAGLPITKGPQTQGENGKGGKKGRL